MSAAFQGKISSNDFGVQTQIDRQFGLESAKELISICQLPSVGRRLYSKHR